MASSGSQDQAASAKRFKQTPPDIAAVQNGVNTMEVEQQPTTTLLKATSDEQTSFQSISLDILCHILGYLMTPRAKAASSPRSVGFQAPSFPVQESSISWERKDLLSNQRSCANRNSAAIATCTPFELMRLCRDLSLVSKQWKVIVGLLMNRQAHGRIISPLELFQLKCRALTLDLESVCLDFIETIKDKWGRIRIDGYDDEAVYVLDVIFSEYGATEEGFANIVATEYVKFLIVKSVETLVYNKAYRKEALLVHVWKELCQPPRLVKLFWETHMLSPKKYARDCNILLGNLLGEMNSIDNILDRHEEASYLMWEPLDGSDYESKRDILFQFESHIPCTRVYFGRFGDYGMDNDDLFEESFSIRKVATAIWEKLG